MKIMYDLAFLPERPVTRARKSEETTAIIGFLASQKKNMCFEYDTEEECLKRYKSARAYRRTAKLQEAIDLFRKGNRVYIIRLPRKKKGGRDA